METIYSLTIYSTPCGATMYARASVWVYMDALSDGTVLQFVFCSKICFGFFFFGGTAFVFFDSMVLMSFVLGERIPTVIYDGGTSRRPVFRQWTFPKSPRQPNISINGGGVRRCSLSR